MKKIKFAAMILAVLGAFALAPGMDAGEGKKNCKYSQDRAEGKKACKVGDKQACDWSKCDKTDCDKHAGLWESMSVSDFYDI